MMAGGEVKPSDSSPRRPPSYPALGNKRRLYSVEHGDVGGGCECGPCVRAVAALLASPPWLWCAHTHTHKASRVLSALLWLHPLCTFSLNHASFSASLKCQLSHLKSYAEPLERVLLLSHLKARTGPALCCACMPPRRLQPLRLQRPVKEVGACWTCCAADRHAEAPLPCHGLELVEWHEWKEAVFRRWRVQTGGVRHANNSGPHWLTTPTGTDITLLLQCQILLHWMSDVKSNAPKNRIG